MARRATARLPGIRFETQAPPLGDSLPRMDVAAFAGFTASGPIGVPVAVDDVEELEAIFGSDAPLAWDVQRGEQVYACLAPSVRAFFRNGGRRAWIVRVAGKQARVNCFAVPGLARLHRTRGIAPAGLKARAKGSWSDDLRVGAVLIPSPLVLAGASFVPPLAADLGTGPGRDLSVGDLVRVTFAGGDVLMFSIGSVSAAHPVDRDAPPHVASPPRDRRDGKLVRATAGASVWFRMPDQLPVARVGRARFFTPDGRRRVATVTASGDPETTWAPGRPVAVDLETPAAGPPPSGSLMRVDFGSDQLWLTVRDARVTDDPESPPPSETVRIVGEGLWWLRQPPAVSLDTVTRAERLRLELRVRRGAAAPVRVGDLGFEPDHPRFWAGQPDDQSFYETAPARRHESPGGAVEVAAPARFPLSGFDSPPAFYFPIAMPIVSDDFLGRTGFSTTPLERDGLAQFDETLFLDPQLSNTGIDALMGEADYIEYIRPSPRRLSGIHAALRIDEATLVAIPDAVHRGWRPFREQAQPTAGAATQPKRPEWWRFLNCDPRPDIPAGLPRSREEFLDCRLRVISPPVFEPVTGPDPAGTLVLTWSTRANEQYTLLESGSANFDEAVPIYHGAAGRFVVYGRSPGDYFYWVRAEADGQVSDWSVGLAARVRRSTGWQLLPSSEYADDVLIATQRGLIRMAAARGDLLAALALPDHYREAEAIDHAARLKARSAGPGDRTAVRPLGSGEQRAWSYGALYHPWIVSRQGSGAGELRRLPPDGTATGILARRALARGAWIAPANELVRGVIALTPPLARASYLALQAAQVNIIRREPRGFVSLSASTLSDDADLVPINVRRLLILIRRLALREGAVYVFEPNDAGFRRLVQRSFEGLLGQMFARGAFAGATPATSFQVVAGSGLNPSASIDQGRVIVELKVAPSLPLTFLTVRLLQSGDRRLIAEER
jgi:hypothetical protein